MGATSIMLLPANTVMPVDTAKQRNLQMRSGVVQGVTCPDCSVPLFQEQHAYAVVVRINPTVSQTYIVGSDFGWFCPSCPLLIIDSDEVEEFLRQTVRISSFEYVVMGIVTYGPAPGGDHVVQLSPDNDHAHVVTFARKPPVLSPADHAAIAAANARRDRRRLRRKDLATTRRASAADANERSSRERKHVDSPHR